MGEKVHPRHEDALTSAARTTDATAIWHISTYFDQISRYNVYRSAVQPVGTDHFGRGEGHGEFNELAVKEVEGVFIEE